MTLELGEYIWYWNGNISLDQNIPRALWFPDSNSHDPNDYQGHGKEIKLYVVHANEIVRGRTYMRNYEGSFAWLNNNPGNITGRSGGQYVGVDLYQLFLDLESAEPGTVVPVKFLQDGSNPTPSSRTARVGATTLKVPAGSKT